VNSFFLDGSALAKRYVAEPGTPLLDHLGQEIIHAPTLRKVEATNALVIAALMHIETHSINATDAIVLHAALALGQHFRTRGDDLVLFASDLRLLRAAQAEGLNTFNPESQDHAALAALLGP
jgi:predicted nucleic acid-binding protein